MKRALVFAMLLAACTDPPPVKVVYSLSHGDAQTCPAKCTDIPLTCDAVLSVRILDPNEPTSSPIDICEPIEPDRDHDLCSIANIDLPLTPLPEQKLEIQVAVFPRSALGTNEEGKPICPGRDLSWAASTGFPVESTTIGVPMPAVGGRSYYHVGDDATTVTLGCTDISSLVCQSTPMTSITSTVDDFALRSPVIDGDKLGVSVGEPTRTETGYELLAGPERRLETTDNKTWSGSHDTFATAACIDVVQTEVESTATITCRRAKPADMQLDIPSWRLDHDTLEAILHAVNLTKVPEQGMTIGMVVDSNLTHVANAQVQAMSGSVLYLENGYTGASTTGATRSNGLFVSLDAPFDTLFSTNIGGQPGGEAIGGNVDSKVTIVVLQFDHAIGG